MREFKTPRSVVWRNRFRGRPWEALRDVRDRPLVLQRFPDGIEEEGFYQKQIGSHFPDWIDTVRVELCATGDDQTLVVCNNKATLAYLADQGVLTLHPWLSRRDRLEHPDLLVIDLDPPGERFELARRAALSVRRLLGELELPGFPKLTGSKGIHYGQTAVAPWSLRPLRGAPIAAPVAWSDLERPGIGPRDYTLENVFRRIAQREDPWAKLRRRRRSLDRAEEALRKRIKAEGG